MSTKTVELVTGSGERIAPAEVEIVGDGFRYESPRIEVEATIVAWSFRGSPDVYRLQTTRHVVPGDTASFEIRVDGTPVALPQPPAVPDAVREARLRDMLEPDPDYDNESALLAELARVRAERDAEIERRLAIESRLEPSAQSSSLTPDANGWIGYECEIDGRSCRIRLRNRDGSTDVDVTEGIRESSMVTIPTRDFLALARRIARSGPDTKPIRSPNEK